MGITWQRLSGWIGSNRNRECEVVSGVEPVSSIARYRLNFLRLKDELTFHLLAS